MAEIINDPNQNYDAQQLVEEMAEGEQKRPQVNVEADYEASKAYDVSDIDKNNNSPIVEDSKPQSAEPTTEETEAKPTGNPDDYREMAQETNPRLKA